MCNKMSGKYAYHHIGLIGWHECTFKGSDVVFCDSLSLKFMAAIFGIKLKYLPGALSVKNLDLNDSQNFYLCPHELSSFPREKCFILPFQTDWSHIDGTLRETISRLDNNTTVYVAISSPKQNKLATMINEQFNLSVHAVGAALLDLNSSQSFWIRLVSGRGLEWLVRALYSPKRFFSKIFVIQREVVKIILSAAYRKRFIAFCRSIETRS